MEEECCNVLFYAWVCLVGSSTMHAQSTRTRHDPSMINGGRWKCV